MDAASNEILTRSLALSADLLTRAEPDTDNSTSESGKDETSGRPPIYKTVGIILAVCSGLFIGVSFVVKKVGLLKANVKYNEEAGEGYGYLKNWWWWLGMTLMIIGEICNFVAYAFADAILVTPLGALSVVVTTILSAIFLKERLSFVGKVGCFMCIIGSVVIAVNAPEQAAVSNIQDMQHYVIAPGFLSYAGVIIVGSIAVAWFVAPKYGKKSMLVYLTICSLVGGLSVVATQGLGAAVLAAINGQDQFTKWFLYVLFVFVIATLLTEIIYLNVSILEHVHAFMTRPANSITESAQYLQRRPRHADLLRVLHLEYHRRIGCPIPGLPRYGNADCRRCDGLPRHLLRGCPSPARQIKQRRTGHGGLQRRPGPGENSRRTRRA